MRRAAVALLFALLPLGASTRVRAEQAPAPPQPAPPQPAQHPTTSSENRALAETLFFTARGLMEAGRYAEAAVKLAESYRLDPAPGTLLNLAVCHQKTGKIASAWGEFRQALVDAKRAGRADREELATKAIEELEPELPWLSIDVPTDARVRGLEITRNGVPLSAASWATELPVDPGDVEIGARAPGYKPQTQHVVIARKQHLSVMLQPLELAPVEAKPSEGWTTRRKVGVAIVGAGLASVALGAVTGAVAISRRSDSDAACPLLDGERRCTQAGVDAMSKARTLAIWSDVGFGVGAVALVAGVYLFVSGGRKEAPPPTTALRFGLSVGGGGAQGFVGSAF